MTRARSSWKGTLVFVFILILLTGILAIWIGIDHPPNSFGHRAFLVGIICCATVACAAALLVLGMTVASVLRRQGASLPDRDDTLLDIFLDEE